jgi:large subunit ribosomal protein L25
MSGMTKDSFALSVEPREVSGKKVKRLRVDGVIPVVVYGQGKKPQNGQVDAHTFGKLYQKAGESSVVQIAFGKEELPVLIHSVDRHPVRDNIIHVDFLQIDMQKEVQTSVKLKHVGAAPAVKEFGGVVVSPKDTLHIKCLPKDLVQELEVDLGVLGKIGDAIHVKDLKLPNGITALDSADAVIVMIAAPRAEEETKPAVTETAVPAEGAAPAEGAPAAEGAAAPAAEGKEAKK